MSVVARKKSAQPTSQTWRDFAAMRLAGVCAEEVILGYRGAGSEEGCSNATELILDLLDAGDPALGPSRTAIEAGSGVHGQTAGSEVMRGATWHLTKLGFDECWQLAIRLVGEHHTKIERLAQVLLNTKKETRWR